jgi:hypothetical protein
LRAPKNSAGPVTSAATPPVEWFRCVVWQLHLAMEDPDLGLSRVLTGKDFCC